MASTKSTKQTTTNTMPMLKFSRRGIPSTAIVEPTSLLKEFECGMCTQLCVEPHVTTCHHMFCKQCWADARSMGNNQCPIDGQTETAKKLADLKTSNAILHRMYDAIKLRCPFAETRHCSWTGTTSTLLEHITKCEAQLHHQPTTSGKSLPCDGTCQHAEQLRAKLDEATLANEASHGVHQPHAPVDPMQAFHHDGEEGAFKLIRLLGGQFKLPVPTMNSKQRNHLFNCIVNTAKNFRDEDDKRWIAVTLIKLAIHSTYFDVAKTKMEKLIELQAELHNN